MQLVVGRVTRPHGVRGEVSVEVRTDDPDRRFAVGRVLATDPAAAGPLTVASVRWHSGRLLIQFAGIADRDQAESCAAPGSPWTPPRPGPSDDPDEFHDHELIGLAVVTTSGEPVGRVTDVRHFGQDLLVIEPAAAPDPRPGPRLAQAGHRRAAPVRGPQAAARRWPGRPGAPRRTRAAGPVRGRDRARGRRGRRAAGHRPAARAARAGRRGTARPGLR